MRPGHPPPAGHRGNLPNASTERCGLGDLQSHPPLQVRDGHSLLIRQHFPQRPPDLQQGSCRKDRQEWLSLDPCVSCLANGQSEPVLQLVAKLVPAEFDQIAGSFRGTVFQATETQCSDGALRTHAS